MRKFYSLVCFLLILFSSKFCFALEAWEASAEWHSWDSSGVPDFYVGPYDSPYFEGSISESYVKLSEYNSRLDVIEYQREDAILFHLSSVPDLSGFLFDINYSYFNDESSPVGIMIWNDLFSWDSRMYDNQVDRVRYFQTSEGDGWLTDNWHLSIHKSTELYGVNIRLIFEDFTDFHLDSFSVVAGYCIPIPSTIWLFAFGVIGLLCKFKRFNSRMSIHV